MTVQIKTNNAVRVVGNASQLVKFTEPDEKMAYFNLEGGSITGIGKVEIIATSGKEKTSYEVIVTNNIIFYLTKINNIWYITLIDKIETDCSK